MKWWVVKRAIAGVLSEHSFRETWSSALDTALVIKWLLVCGSVINTEHGLLQYCNNTRFPPIDFQKGNTVFSFACKADYLRALTYRICTSRVKISKININKKKTNKQTNKQKKTEGKKKELRLKSFISAYILFSTWQLFFFYRFSVC